VKHVPLGSVLFFVLLALVAAWVVTTLIGGGYHECDPYTNGGCR
jgi:cytochrome b